jgi:fimbrial chaperone protein
MNRHGVAAAAWWTLALLTLTFSARASTLQISPVTLDLSPGESASGITLRNPGDSPLYGQVRVFRWDQANGEDVLTPTTDLVASPPLIQIPAHTDQLIRLVRAIPAPVSAEQSYRLLIDELPAPGEPVANGVTIRLRYSVPVFVEPSVAAGAPTLSWRLLHNGAQWTLRVDNSGSRRAQIAAVQVFDGTGHAHEINTGLLGYALAGRSRQWPVTLPPDLAMSGTMKVRAQVNALPAESTLDAQ